MTTRLKSVLQAYEEDLRAAWFERMLESYPEESRKYFKKVNRDFANPVGSNLHHSLSALLHELLQENPDADIINEQVQMILRIKAVQEVLPSQAVSFIPALKQIIEKNCGTALKKEGISLEEWLDFYSDIDTVALYAFDSYSESRTLIYEMRLAQIKETNDILVKANLLDQALDMENFMQCSSSLDGECSSCGGQCQVDIVKGV